MKKIAFTVWILLLIGLGLWVSWRLFEHILPPPKLPHSEPHTPEPAPKSPRTQPKPPVTPGSKPPTIKGSEPQTPRTGRYEAYEYINRLRQTAGLIPLERDSTLSKAASLHAKYSVFNDFQGHTENAQRPHFIGTTPTERARKQGYHGYVSEVISYNRPRMTLFVDDLMSAIYHRLGLMAMDIDLIGTGYAKDAQGAVETALVAVTGNRALDTLCQTPLSKPRPGELFLQGVCKHQVKLPVKAWQKARLNLAKSQPKIVTWPPEGATVPPVFYEETPDPLPQCNASGYPPHIQINPVYQGRIEFIANSFKLYRLAGNQRHSVTAETQFTNRSDPHQTHSDAQTNAKRNPLAQKDAWYAFFPKRRLQWGTRYEASVLIKEAERITPVTWQFQTQSLPGLHTLKPNTKPSEVRAQVGKPLTLYFPPEGCQAPNRAEIQTRLPKHVQLDKAFLDGQTFQFTLTSARVGDRLEFWYAPTKTRVQVIVSQPET